MMGKKNSNRFVRKQNSRPIRKSFLIVCEGERTEPNYFKYFRVPKEIYDVYGAGANTDSLVKKAVEIKGKSGKKFDQIWCVFDRDSFISFPVKNFNNAFLLAKKRGN